MSLFDEASLIVTPNAFKASKLYSIKPTDGSGDLSVVRATTATRVNSAGLIETVSANVPRLDYTNSTCPSILVEPQRTNLVLRSEEFNVSPWGTLGTTTITPNATNSPSGNLTADLILGADSTSSVNQIIAGTIGVVYTNSFYIKNNNSTQSRLMIRNTITAVECNINWSGSILSSITNLTGTTTFQSVDNGWYRIISTYTSLELPQRPRILPTSTTNQSVYIWGAQLEAGANATSYIPTVASAVTRNADVISKTGISSLINSVEGCFYVEASSFINGGSFRLISISDGTTNNRITMGWSSITNTLLVFMNIGGTIRINNNITLFNQTSNNKVLFKWGSGNFKVFINGVEKLSLTSVTMPTTNLFNRLGFDLGSSGNNFEGNVNEVIVFPTQLTDTECINLTTI
jgi:hypothetical protein